MPEWKDMTILLSSKPFGETGMLVSVLSKNNGRYKSFVHGGNSVKKRSIFQKGNICNAEWKARISDQIGSIKLELVSSTATNFFNLPIQLTALSAVCEISDYILPEREPNQNIFVPKTSHKAMILGKSGQNIKRIGILARKEMEKVFNKKIHLYTRVKIQENCLTNINLLKSSGLNIDA